MVYQLSLLLFYISGTHGRTDSLYFNVNLNVVSIYFTLNKYIYYYYYYSNPEPCDPQSGALTSTSYRTVYKLYNANLRTVTLIIENANKI